MRNAILLILIALSISCKQVGVESEYSVILDNSFIWTGSIDNTEQSYVAFRKGFNLNELPEKAEIRIFADNRYVLWINGNFIDLGPSRFDPKNPQYDIFDINKFLIKGNNAVSILVHNYLFNQQNIKSCRIIKNHPGLTALLTINKKRSKPMYIVTDTTWKCSAQTEYLPSPASFASIDDNINRNLIGSWQLPEYDDSDWQYASEVTSDYWGAISIRAIPYLLRDTISSNKIIEWKQNNIPKRQEWLLKEELPLTLETGDEVIIDIGQYVQAITEIDLNVADTGIIEIDYAGRYYQNNFTPETTPSFEGNAPKVSTIYIAKKGKQKFRSNDSHGYKYLVIACPKGTVSIENLKVINRLYPFEKLGEFKSNDTLLNKIWDISINTIRLSSEDAYVSSIGYERGQWVGDAVKVSYPIANLVFATKQNGNLTFHDNRLLKNTLRHTAYSQFPNGRVIAECPPSSTYDTSWRLKDKESGLVFHFDDYACIWIEGVNEIGKQYKDLEFVKEMWAFMTKQIDFFLNYRSNIGLIKASEFFFYGNPMAFKICEGATVNAFIYGALRNMQSMAKALKKSEQYSFYKASADSLFEKYNSVFWIDSLKMYSGGILNNELHQPTIHAAIAALTFNIVPEDRIPFIIDYIKSNLNSTNIWPYTYLYVFDLIFKYPMIFQDINPLILINEKWQSMLNYETGLTSEGFSDCPLYYDHRAGAVPAYVLSKYVFGVTEKPEKIEIKPRLFHLSEVKGAVCTKFGLINMEIYRTDDLNITFKIQLPDNSEKDYMLIFKMKSEDFTLEINNKRYKSYTIENDEIHIPIPSKNINGNINFYNQHAI